MEPGQQRGDYNAAIVRTENSANDDGSKPVERRGESVMKYSRINIPLLIFTLFIEMCAKAAVKRRATQSVFIINNMLSSSSS